MHQDAVRGKPWPSASRQCRYVCMACSVGQRSELCPVSSHLLPPSWLPQSRRSSVVSGWSFSPNERLRYKWLRKRLCPRSINSTLQKRLGQRSSDARKIATVRSARRVLSKATSTCDANRLRRRSFITTSMLTPIRSFRHSSTFAMTNVHRISTWLIPAGIGDSSIGAVNLVNTLTTTTPTKHY